MLRTLLSDGGSAHRQWLRSGATIPHEIERLERQVRQRYRIAEPPRAGN